jgi:hypothetical protein
MPVHEPLIMTVCIPVTVKARHSAETWANTWQVKKSEALRAILRRGLLAVLPLPRMKEHSRDYGAKLGFRVPGYMLSMIEQLQEKEPDWEHVSILRSAFYQGLLEVQKDGQMVATPKPPIARNRSQITLPL